jgi:hypothetical protein
MSLCASTRASKGTVAPNSMPSVAGMDQAAPLRLAPPGRDHGDGAIGVGG